MCGRFVSASPPDELARYFGADQVGESVAADALEPSWNVAPTNDVYVVVEDGRVRKVEAFHWGLVPFWAKELSIGNRMINARAEGLAEKSAYKRAYAKRRCIIPADGFYEWRKVPGQKRKQPMYLQRKDGEPLAFAGLWEVWRGPKDAEPGSEGPSEEHPLRSTTIITGQPNELVAQIHDRMPVILPPSAWDAWLDPEQHDLDVLGKLLVPAPAELLAVHPVSTEVNNVRNDGPQLTEEAPPLHETDAATDGATGGAGDGEG